MRPWECPRCRKINSPWLNQCFCSPAEVPTTVVELVKPAIRAALLPARVRNVAPTQPLALVARGRSAMPFDFDTDEDQETEIVVMPGSFELRMDDD